MGLVNDTKINQVLSLKYAKGLLFSNWLEGQGFSNQLLRRYRNSGWLETLCRGVMYREQLPLKGMIALTCFNEQLNKDYRVAAHSALELAGFSHYVPMGKPLLVVAHPKGNVPAWLGMDAFDYTFFTFSTDAFSAPLTTTYKVEGFNVLASVPEQAFMAEKAGHYWFDMLDTSQIDIGTGKMQLTKGGTYISKYKITVPTELHQYE